MHFVSKQLGSRLKEQRTRLGLTTRAIASEVGMSPAWVNQCEAGDRKVSPHALWAFMQALKVHTNWAMVEDGNLPPLEEMLRVGDPYPGGLLPQVTPEEHILKAIHELESAIRALKK